VLWNMRLLQRRRRGRRPGPSWRRSLASCRCPGRCIGTARPFEPPPAQTADDHARSGCDERPHSARRAAQEKALLDVYPGKLGGPIADFAKLVGEVVSVERAAITLDVQGGRGTLKVGDVSYAELEPYKGPDGSTTVLSNTIFSTVPGAPVFVGKATRYRSKHATLGHDLDMTGHNALQSTFVFDA
jgi:hypothetical protein